MRATTGSGKGCLPREGQYSKKAQALYAKGHARTFGIKCSACKGKGYLWGNPASQHHIKETCSKCNGIGISKG